MPYKKTTLRIVGETAYIPHNSQLSDPLCAFSLALKATSGKRKKVESDYEEMGRIEFLGSLYLMDGKPCIPAHVFEAALNGGARKSKLGKQASAGLLVKQGALLEYDGPKEPEQLWLDKRFVLRVPVRVGTAMVMRTRPMFLPWAAKFIVEVNEELVNVKDVRQWMKTAGEELGIGDWRPQKRGHYGLFSLAE